MEISYSHRFIFIHVYRVAGQSVSAALKPYSHVPRRRAIDRVPLVRRIGYPRIRKLIEHRHGHIKAKELRASVPELFDPFFKFAFVRNPWDWQVSIYHYVRQRTDHPDHDFFCGFRDFEDYLGWRIHDQGPELQCEFVLDDAGELIVDFVGHFETLAEDFGTVCEHVGIESALPHRNRSTRTDFRDYYTPETRALVADAYRGDIEFFGYEFDEVKALPPLGRAAERSG